MGSAVGEWVQRVKGVRSTLLLQNSDGDVKYSIGNIGNDILITMYGTGLGTGFVGMITC